jgi:hypothetical protein
VKGCLHMSVFMAGQIKHGREVSQARNTQLCSGQREGREEAGS